MVGGRKSLVHVFRVAHDSKNKKERSSLWGEREHGDPFIEKFVPWNARNDTGQSAEQGCYGNVS